MNEEASLCSMIGHHTSPSNLALLIMPMGKEPPREFTIDAAMYEIDHVLNK